MRLILQKQVQPKQHNGMIAVSDHIPSRQLATTSGLEVQLDFPPPLLAACVYIPSACSDIYFTSMINFIQSLKADGNGDVLLVGDFNSPYVNWSTLTASNPCSSVLCDTFAKNLIKLVDEKTHALGNILDLISTNCIDKISNISIVPNFILDHHLFDVATSHPACHSPQGSLVVDLLQS